ncbi:hypothetical protein Hanom_Chr05g00459161 [Helianthus anomalus]
MFILVKMVWSMFIFRDFPLSKTYSDLYVLVNEWIYHTDRNLKSKDKIDRIIQFEKD